MSSPYPGQAAPPPARAQLVRFLPFAVGSVAVIGLVGTLLPMWSLTVQRRELGIDAPRYDVDTGSVVPDGSSGGAAAAHVGVYDWILSGASISGVIPIALALAIAISATQLLRGNDRTLWGAAGASALGALIVVVITAIRPRTEHTVTGPLALELDGGSGRSLNDSVPMDVGIEAGFMLAVAALITICALTGWQYAVTRSRR